MIATLIAWSAETLEDPTYGLNALRLAMPLLPNEPRPAEAGVYHQNRDGWAARAEMPAPELLKHGPIVWLRQANEFESQFLAEDRPRPATIDLAVLAAVASNNAAEGLRTVNHLLRCAHRALLRPFQISPGAEPAVLHGTVEIQPGDGGTTWLPPAGPEHLLLGGFVVPFRVLDNWALGF